MIITTTNKSFLLLIIAFLINFINEYTFTTWLKKPVNIYVYINKMLIHFFLFYMFCTYWYIHIFILSSCLAWSYSKHEVWILERGQVTSPEYAFQMNSTWTILITWITNITHYSINFIHSYQSRTRPPVEPDWTVNQRDKWFDFNKRPKCTSNPVL